jgi:RNase H-like domain found in reverse transcriptase
MMLDHLKPFQIQVNSLLFDTGGILTQINTDRDRHPCTYLSRSLTKKQRNYDTGDRELLAIVQALKEWRHYIQKYGHKRLSYLIMIIFDTSKFHKPLDDKWLDGLYIYPSSISNWFIFQEKRTYKLIHYHKDQTYAHKEQTTKMSLYYRNICLLISSTWNYRRR